MIRVYLAEQILRDGRSQFRKWSPDVPNTFLGYESQTSYSKAWIENNGFPTWPECLRAPLPSVPYKRQKLQEPLKPRGEYLL